MKPGAAAAAAPSPRAIIAAGTKTRPVDLDKQLRAILELPNQSERRQALEDLAEALAHVDPAGAREMLNRILTEKGEGGPDAYAFVSGFASEYSALNPKAAAEWGESLPPSLKFNAWAFVAKEWAKADLPAATAWAEKISDLSLRTQVLRRIGQELEGTGEPKAMAAWARQLAGSADAAQHSEMVGRLWAKGDAPGAFQWATQIAEPARQVQAVVVIAGVVAEQDAPAAADWVGKFPPGEMRTQAAVSAAAKWAEKDPEAAAHWLLAFGDQRLLELGLHSVASRWLEKDRDRAASWIRNAPLPQRTKDYLLPGG